MNLEPDEAAARLHAVTTAQSQMRARAASIHRLLVAVVVLMNVAALAQLLPRPFAAPVAVAALVFLIIAVVIRSRGRTRGMNALLAPRGQHVLGRITLTVVILGAPVAAAILFSLGNPGWLLPIAAVISITAIAIAPRIWVPRRQPVPARR